MDTVNGAALRVAVTRAEDAEGPLWRALRRHGLEPVACPVVREEETPDRARLISAASRLERYPWMVVASARAVRAIAAARDGRPFPPGLRTAAAGPRTAAALVESGAASPLTAGTEGALALIEALRGADRWPGRRVLLPRAEAGGRELAESLRGFGAEVDEVVAYRTVAVEAAEIADRWRACRVEAAVVASPSAARALAGAVGAEALGRLEALVAIGPTTARALAGLRIAASIPPRSDFESVAAFLSAAADRAGGRSPR